VRVISRHFWDIKAENPSLWMLFDHICKAGVPVEQFTTWRMLTRRYDIVHLHWPERHLNRPSPSTALLYTLIELFLLIVARWRGAKVVWTTHNVRAHDRRHPWLEPWCWRAMLKRVDAFVSFSEVGRRIVHETHPQTRNMQSFVIPDGHYRDAYPDRVNREEARASLGLAQDARVILFFGAIRSYKKVPMLAKVFRELKESDLRLVIAGKSNDKALTTEIERAIAGDARIRFDCAFIPDERVQYYMNAADLVVLPYRDILNSGSALLALSFSKPILVSGKETMAELQELAGSDWVRLFDPPLTAEALSEALHWARDGARRVRFEFAWGEWSIVASRYIEAYRAILEERQS